MRTFLAAAALFALFSACEKRSSDVPVPVVPQGATASPHYRGGWMIVTIDNSGRRTIEHQSYETNEGLRERFAKVFAANPTGGIAIRADAHAPYEAITTIMLLARSAGLTQIFLLVGQAGESDSGKRTVTEDSSLNLVLE